MIILTSFKESRNILKRSAFSDASCYSVARFQPAGFNYPELPFFFAVDIHGNKLSLTRSGGLDEYKKELNAYYGSIWVDITDFVRGLDPDETNMFCCWCPHASHSKEQMRIYNTFVCHTGLVGRAIQYIRQDIDIYMDHDHSIHLVDDYKPTIFNQLVL
jgi:hypothetical protein